MSQRSRRIVALCLNKKTEDYSEETSVGCSSSEQPESNVLSVHTEEPEITSEPTSPYADSSNDYLPPEQDSESSGVEQPIQINQNNENQERKSRGRKKQETLSRKRKRNSANWVKNVKKLHKAQGNEYTTVKGKVVSAKILKAPCNCRKKYFEKISLEERTRLFDSFYKLPIEGQNQYIAGSIEERIKAEQRLRNNHTGHSRRAFTRMYFLQVDTHRMEVCQVMFINTLNLTIKKIRVLAEKKRNDGSGVCPPDQRGRHGNQSRTSEADIGLIRKHIEMFPAFESHYSRTHTKKKYLESDLSISKMYKLYKEYCNENEHIPKNEAMYRTVFVEEFNLTFRKPQNDTCGTCDKFNLRLKNADEGEKVQLEEDKQKHLYLAESAYAEKKADRLRSKLIDSTIVTISFDLQKCLPTPYLKSGISFYKRKLWTLNLTIFESLKGKNSAICYLWNETIANRGGQEIASCLYLYLKGLPNDITEVIMYSDCCPGQNRNIFISVMLLKITTDLHREGRDLVINHKFLVPGHTHMEADTLHASIEKTKNATTASIDIPRDWANLIRFVPSTPPIKVIEVQQKDFLNFKSLLSTVYQHRKINSLGDPVVWSTMRWLKYLPNEPGQVFYKTSFNSEENFQNLDLLRKNLRNKAIPPVLPLADSPLKLPALKLKDLKDLIPFIDISSRPYYASFVGNLTGAAQMDEIVSDDNEDDNAEAYF